MKYDFPFLSLTQMAHNCGIDDPVVLGRWLAMSGLREKDPETGLLVPTQRAKDLGLVSTVRTNNDSEFIAWRNPDTIRLLQSAGHSLPSTNGKMVKPALRISDPQVFSWGEKVGTRDRYKIVTGNDQFVAVCSGKENTVRITKALNLLADRKLIKFNDDHPSQQDLFEELFI